MILETSTVRVVLRIVLCYGFRMPITHVGGLILSFVRNTINNNNDNDNNYDNSNNTINSYMASG